MWSDKRIYEDVFQWFRNLERIHYDKIAKRGSMQVVAQ